MRTFLMPFLARRFFMGASPGMIQKVSPSLRRVTPTFPALPECAEEEDTGLSPGRSGELPDYFSSASAWLMRSSRLPKMHSLPSALPCMDNSSMHLVRRILICTVLISTAVSITASQIMAFGPSGYSAAIVRAIFLIPRFLNHGKFRHHVPP